MLALVAAASAGLPESRCSANRRRGLPVLLDWLEDQPGETWQQRWLASGADAAGRAVGGRPGPVAAPPRHRTLCRRLELMTSSLLVLVGADVDPALAGVAADRREETQAGRAT